jgi:hypothetical protein
MKNIRIFILTVIISIIPFTGLYPQAVKDDNSRHSLGLNASSISGIGLSYGYDLSSSYMIKLNGFYYDYYDDKTSETNPDDKRYNHTRWWNTGTEIQKNLYKISAEGMIINIYCLMGGSYWYYKKERPFYPEDDVFNRHYTMGFGLGVKLIIFSRCSVNLDLGYQYSDWINDKRKYTGLGGGLGTYFIF